MRTFKIFLTFCALTLGASLFVSTQNAQAQLVQGASTKIKVKRSASNPFAGQSTSSGFWCDTSGTCYAWNGTTSSAIGSATIGGTVATGGIAYASGTDTLASETNLTWDASNDRLGVKRSSPQESIETNGDVQIGRIGDMGTTSYFVGLGGTSGIVLGTSGGSAIEFSNDASSNNELYFVTHQNGVSHARRGVVTKEGYFGIGAVSSLGYPLDMRSSSSTTQFHIRSGATSDDGGYLTSTAASNVRLTAGAAWNGSNWIAKTTTAMGIDMLNGVLGLYANQGLTGGNSFTPTVRFSVDSNGQVNLYGQTSSPGGTSATAAFWFDTNSGINRLKINDNNGIYGANCHWVPLTDPGTGAAIPVTSQCSSLGLTSGGSGETNTLANPAVVGSMMAITMQADGGGDIVITVASAYNQAGNTTVTLNDAGDTVVFIGANIGGTPRWRLLVNDGATLG